MDNHPPNRTLRRKWTFRLLAVACALVPFILLEGAFTVLGIGIPDDSVDPFVGFAGVIPLFELNPEQSKYMLSPKREKFFADEDFPAVKSANAFRIFCLGGSTVQGRPYSIETSFTTWLRMSLEQAEPERDWEVINCGGISYASYRLIPILEECLNYEPDLFIICTGHNEFLEDRSYDDIKTIPRWLETPTYLMTKSRTVNVAAEMFGSRDHKKTVLAADADAMLDYKNGIAAFHRDLKWNDAIAVHFEANVRRMVRKARAAEVPILLIQPPSNLSGIPPFKSESGQLTVTERERVSQLKKTARSLYRTDLPQATKLWQQVCELDDQFATNWYELGRCLEILNRKNEAKAAFMKARDLDICPLRMTTPLVIALHQVAEMEDVAILNMHELLESQTTSGILGDNWLVDHVHPSFEGHQKIALAIGDWMESQGFVTLPKDWEETSQVVFQSHFESLDSLYFHRGNKMLKALQKWTQGDTEGPPVEERFPHRIQPHR